MSARAPQAIYDLWDSIHAKLPRSQLGGIVGDTAHSFGYHLARRDLPGSDYSVQLGPDRRGASDCASALDVSLPPDLMKICTSRLHDAAVKRDPRLGALREFCGTLNGSETFPWDLSNDSSEGLGTWDNSHLWHIHLSFYREYADNAAALAPIADVFAGIPAHPKPKPPAPIPSPTPTTSLELPMLVQFPDAPTPTQQKAVWLVQGGTRVWLTASEFGAIDAKTHAPVISIPKHADSHLWLLPTVGPVPA